MPTLDLYAMEQDVAPEQARMVLPQSTMTEWWWSGSLDAFADMCKLRLKEDTQYESRLVAQMIDKEMSHMFPVSWAALVNGEIHVLHIRKRRRITMDVKETLMNVLQTSAAVEIMDEVILATLKSSRDTCAEMRLLLDGDRGTDHLTDLQMKDWTSLVQDIAALDRVIDYYGG
jgi:thymidylate synthase ThyX